MSSVLNMNVRQKKKCKAPFVTPGMLCIGHKKCLFQYCFVFDDNNPLPNFQLSEEKKAYFPSITCDDHILIMMIRS